MTSTPPRGDDAAPPGRAPVHEVTAVVLAPATDPDPGGLLEVVDHLLRQTRHPSRILVAGLDLASAEQVLDHPLGERLGDRLEVRLLPEGAQGRWEVVEDVRRALPVDARHWVWFLAHDSLPEPGALAALAAAPRRSSRVGVVGPKLVRVDDPRLLRPVGHHLTPAGRATDADRPELVDQGQSDLRQDVLGVPLAGALVSSAVLAAVGGLDPAFGEDGVDGLDLSWRTHLAGHRVVVAPDAVVRQGDAGLGVVDPVRTRIRRRQVALARGSLWTAPWRRLGVLVTSALAALALLLVKRPAEAAGEWADIRAVLSPARGWGARRRFRRARSVRPRDLAGLHEPARSGWRSTLDTVGDALDPRVRTAPERQGSSATVATGPVSEEFVEAAGEKRRRGWWSWPLVAAVLVCAVAAGLLWRDLLPGLAPSGHGVTGAELGPAVTDAGGLWSSALDGWRGGGLGHDRPPEAWLLPVAALAAVTGALSSAGQGAAGPALAWLLVLAAPLSVVTAYLGLRRATRRRWLRAALGLGWAGLVPLTSALGDGRAGPVVVHVLAPLLLAGYAVCAARAGGVRRTGAAFGTVLAVAAAAQWVPLVLVVSTLGGVCLLVLGRGSARWRGAVLALLPWMLVLPWVWTLRTGPVRLLGGAGASVAVPGLPSAAEPWQLLLLHPGAPVDARGLEALPLWLTAPLWLAALGALLLRGRAGRRAGVLVAAALACLALALVAVRTGLGVLPGGHAEEGLAVTPWPGTLLSLAGAALLLAAALLLDRLPRRGLAGRSHPAVGTAAVLLLTLPLVALVGVPLVGDRSWSLEPAAAPLPAVAAEQGRGPAAVRTLVLSPGDGATPSVAVDLLGAEPEPGRILRDRTTELVHPERRSDDPVVAAVTALVEGEDPESVARAVGELGVGYLLLQAGEDHPLTTGVDRVAGLTRVSSPPDQVLWRVSGAGGGPGRLQLLDAEGQVLERVEVTGPHARTRTHLSAVPEGAVLSVAEGQGWAGEALVRLDGEMLPLQPDARAPGAVAAVPAGDHELAVDLRRPMLPLHLVSLVLGLVTAFLALPFGRADDEPEEER